MVTVGPPGDGSRTETGTGCLVAEPTGSHTDAPQIGETPAEAELCETAAKPPRPATAAVSLMVTARTEQTGTGTVLCS